MSRFKPFGGPILLVVLAGAAKAACVAPDANRGVFTACLENGTQNQTINRSSATAEAFLNQFTNQSLTGFFPGYTGGDALLALTNFNSVPINVSFPQNSAALTVRIDAIGYNKTFTGTIVNGDVGQARNDARDAFVEDIKRSDLLSQIWKYQAEHTPNHPITGPTGIIAGSTAQNFDQGFTDIASLIGSSQESVTGGDAASAEAAQPGNLVGVALSYSSFTMRDLSTRALTLPLSYTIRNDLDPRRQIVLSLPVSRIKTEQQTTIFGGFGVARRIPLNDAWTVTPALRYSAGGSKDLLIAGQVIAATLSNTFVFDAAGLQYALGNMLGYNRTLKFRGYDPEITEYTMRNGLMLSQPVEFGGRKLALEYSLIDSRYFGTRVYVDNTQELGLTLGTNKKANSSRSFVRGGLNYLHGRETRGFGANIGYWF